MILQTQDRNLGNVQLSQFIIQLIEHEFSVLASQSR